MSLNDELPSNVPTLSAPVRMNDSQATKALVYDHRMKRMVLRTLTPAELLKRKREEKKKRKREQEEEEQDEDVEDEVTSESDDENDEEWTLECQLRDEEFERGQQASQLSQQLALPPPSDSVGTSTEIPPRRKRGRPRKDSYAIPGTVANNAANSDSSDGVKRARMSSQYNIEASQLWNLAFSTPVSFVIRLRQSNPSFSQEVVCRNSQGNYTRWKCTPTDDRLMTSDKIVRGTIRTSSTSCSFLTGDGKNVFQFVRDVLQELSIKCPAGQFGVATFILYQVRPNQWIPFSLLVQNIRPGSLLLPSSTSPRLNYSWLDDLFIKKYESKSIPYSDFFDIEDAQPQQT